LRSEDVGLGWSLTTLLNLTCPPAWFSVGLLLLLMDTFLALPFGHLLAGLYEGWKAPSFIAASSGDRMGPGPRLGGLLVAAVAPRRPS